MGNYLKTFGREENQTTWVYVNHPRRDQPLQPMGMIGPVRLYTGETADRQHEGTDISIKQNDIPSTERPPI